MPGSGCAGRGRLRAVLVLVLAAAAGAAACGRAAAAPAASPSASSRATALAAYARCMRAHGLPDFPDLTGGTLVIKTAPAKGRLVTTVDGKPLAVTSASPRFQAAQRACRGKLPPGIAASGAPGRAAQRLAQAKAYAVCMRAHGVANFPDPRPDAGGFFFPPAKGLNPSAPAFKAASRTCRGKLPGAGS